jgi:hypothetical protein
MATLFFLAISPLVIFIQNKSDTPSRFNDVSIINSEYVPFYNPNIIEGVLVAGGNRELIGKQSWLDMKGLSMLLDLCKGRKIKSYITHASLSIDRTTREIGYFDNFRIEGEYLIADFHFFEAAVKHDAYRVEMLREMINVMPEEFGVSLAILATYEWVFIDGDTIPWHPDHDIESDTDNPFLFLVLTG